MEDEDEVLKPVEAPPSSSERPQADKPDSIPEQCDTVFPTGYSPARNDVASPSTVAEGDEEVKREKRENEVSHVEELETDEVAKEVDDSKPVTEELEVKDEEERENEGANVEELESERKEEVIEEESVRKEEDLPPVSDEFETNQPDEEVTEKVELAEEAEDMKEEKPESDGEKAVVEMKQEEEEGASKGEAMAEDNGNELSPLVGTKDEEEMVEEETPVTMKDEEEEEETPVTMKDEEEDTLVTMKDEETPADMKDEEVVEEEEETEAVKSGSGGNGGKRKRGRNANGNTPVRAPGRKTVGEDVCFICLDGGALVLCDRRGCPKAYHPSCVDHDEEFFKTKGKWNCGWHLCNTCGKNAYFMCYTCTFSLCKGCCKDAVVFCIRGNKGFCESCMKTVMMIENSDQNEMDQVAFDDRSSWEYLFKDYWIEQRKKLCITSDELSQAKSPWKSYDATDKQQTQTVVHEGNDDVETDSDSFLGDQELTGSKRKKVKRKSKSVDSDTDSSSEKDISTPKRKTKRRSKSQTKAAHSDSEHSSWDHDTNTKRRKRPRRLSKAHSKQVAAKEGFSADGNVEWASKELLEFVLHMKDGDKSVLTQFDVQGLLLEYIKRNKLRDPRRQSQIICDTMLQKLFGKPRVGHFEMLKLLESHFLLKEDSQADDNHGSVVDDISQLEADDNTDSLMDAGRSKGRKSRKKGEVSYQSNLDDYAAIDMHNINLIYLRRNLMEALMEDSEAFHDKVVGAFVRIRISGSSQKQDIYRLVQIIGTSKAAEPYKFGKRITDAMLEILNLDKTEVISIDTISNQDFTEDECKRLRQSIKCGLISRMTVGDVLEKARELHEVRVTDWLEAEIVRLSHLRDRASEKGRKREYPLS